MNAKKAKHLRAVARGTSATNQTSYQKLSPQRIFAPMDIARVGKSAIWLGQSVLHADCMRAHYQKLKREMRSA